MSKKVTSEKQSEYIRKWKKENPEKVKQYKRKYDAKTKIKKRVKNPELLKESSNNLRKETTCKIIKHHHEDLKDDPERLSTEFIQRLIGIECVKMY